MNAALEPMVGRYLHLQVENEPYRIYFEEAGGGIPLLCLHTAGAHSSQYRHLLCDEAVTGRFRVVAFDLDAALAFEGETGPYLQYSVVRARNILARFAAEEGDEAIEAERLAGQVDLDGIAAVFRPDHDGVGIDRHRQHEAVVVVGVLADQVDAPGGAHQDRRAAEALGEGGLDPRARSAHASSPSR